MSLLFNSALKYVGTKFLHQGRSIHGLDCLGLLIVSAMDVGIKFDDCLDYPELPNELKLRDELRRQLAISDKGEIHLIKCSARSPAVHIGLVCDGRIVHSIRRFGVVHTAVPAKYTTIERYEVK